MYIVFGNEIIDSSEIKDIIENNSDFNVESEYENSWVTVTIFKIIEK